MGRFGQGRGCAQAFGFGPDLGLTGAVAAQSGGIAAVVRKSSRVHVVIMFVLPCSDFG